MRPFNPATRLSQTSVTDATFVLSVILHEFVSKGRLNKHERGALFVWLWEYEPGRERARGDKDIRRGRGQFLK